LIRGNSSLTDRSLFYIANLAYARNLSAAELDDMYEKGYVVTGKVISCPGLEILDISENSSITDQGIFCLCHSLPQQTMSTMASPWNLSAQQAAIDAAEVDEKVRFFLKEIYLESCPSISFDGVRQIMSHYPNLAYLHMKYTIELAGSRLYSVSSG
jgi:hypothetical protein